MRKALKRAVVFCLKRRRAKGLLEDDLWPPLAPEVNAHFAVAIDILDEIPVVAGSGTIAKSHLSQPVPFIDCGEVFCESHKGLIDFDASPNGAPVDALRPGYPAVGYNLVELCGTDTDVFGGSHRERPRGARLGGRQLIPALPAIRSSPWRGRGLRGIRQRGRTPA